MAPFAKPAVRRATTHGIALAACLAWFLPVLADKGYYQFPAVHGDSLAFTAEGDLWTAPLEGGAARRLTTHAGLETHPAFSPDGSRIAFLATYDAGPDVYVMPAAGGEPRRLTYQQAVVSVEGWTPDGRVLFVSDAVPGLVRSTLVRSVDPESLALEDWPLAGANEAALGPDGTRYFTRNGLHRTGDHARYYRGGAMAELWRHGDGNAEAMPLFPDLEANAMRPRWAADRLLFVADVDGRFGLWSVDGGGGDLTRHAAFEDRDVRRIAASGSTVVFQLGADLWRHDLAAGNSERIELTLASDLEGRRARWIENPLRFAGGIAPGPDGKQVAIAVRGQAAVLGLTGERRILLDTPATDRVRAAVPGVEGDWIYAIVGSGTGERIVRYPADGAPGAEILVEDEGTFRLSLYPSPDGRHLAHTDFDGQLWLLDLDRGRNRQLDHSPQGNDSIYDVAWSTDGERMAWVRPAPTTRTPQVMLHDLGADRTEAITSDRFPAYAPAFSSDGRILYFVSDRHFSATPGSPWGDRNMGPAFDRRGQLFGLTLDLDVRFPFLPESLGPAPANEEGDDEAEDENGSSEEKETPAAPAIAWEGLASRLHAVPVDPGNYGGLAAADKHLYVVDRPLVGDPVLKSIAVDEHAKVETFVSGVTDYALTANRKRLYYRVGDAAYLVDAGAKAPDDLARSTVDLGGWRLRVDPAAEWEQMFDDAWRMHRAFFFDGDLRGVDWAAVRRQHAPLVARVQHRSELDDLLGEMTAELGILHSQVGRAELPVDPEKVEPASLAAEFRATRGGLEVTDILRGDPDLLDERSPLARPEVGVAVGDVLVSVDHRPVDSPAALHAALMGQAGRPVLLEVRRGDGEARFVRTKPVAASELPRRRYRDWEQGRRDHVADRSDGRVGYLHLYAMGSSDVADFAREFYAQIQREGLVIDVRNNRGGNVDSWVINALLRRAWAFWQTADADETSFENMQQAFRGHVAVLVDEYTYSDGETFAAGIKALGLAPLIGQRTAGAGIWLSDRNRLSDGGIARVAEFAQFAPDGTWLIEGLGVAPDIAVENLPRATYDGEDAQLDRAIDLLLERIAAVPVPALRGEDIAPVGTPARDIR